jgi:hypothetical protein
MVAPFILPPPAGTVGNTTGPMVTDVVMYNHLCLGGSKSIGSTITPTGTTSSQSLASALNSQVGQNNPELFTDAVVNIDGNQQFACYSASGFDFPSSAALVEAARGNLESKDAASKAGVDIAALNVTPKSGYKDFYQKSARAALQPAASASSAVLNFLYEIAQFSNFNFGFIAFNDTTGTSTTSTFTAPNVSSLYPQGGTSDHPLPYIPISTSLAPNANNYNTITNILPSLDVWGERNTAQGLKSALDQFAAKGRPGANKVIVLVTNGIPTEDLNGATNPTTATADALKQAVRAKNMGIPIYCVAVSQSDSDKTNEDNLYNDTSHGIAAISGHGAKYYRVDYTNAQSTQSTLSSVLANIARQLSSLLLK